MIKKILLLPLFLFFSLALFSQIDEEEFDLPEDTILYDTTINNLSRSCQKIDSIVNYALSKRGARYKFGSAGPKVFDCSGFTYYTFKKFGVELLRSSRQQYTMGKKIKKNEIQKGDLVFFLRGRSGNRYIGHVGLVIEVDSNHVFKFIHASSPKYGVRIDVSTKEGYARSYAGARRIIDCDSVSNTPIILPNEPITEDLVIQIDSVHADTVQLLPRPNDPKITYHRVKSGETLSHISRKYHVSVANIKKWNNLRSDLIRIDQRLKIYR